MLGARCKAMNTRDLVVYSLSGEKDSEPVNTYIITNCDKCFKENEYSVLIGRLQTVWWQLC